MWASVEPLRGDEFLQADRQGASVTTTIVIRYQSGIEPQMRAVWGSHTYDIQSVINIDERQRETHLMCREIIA